MMNKPEKHNNKLLQNKELSIKIAICDDLKKDRDHLASNLDAIASMFHISFHISPFASGIELLSSTDNFDIIFLDIVMDELDGIETLKRLQNTSSLIVFMSTTNDRLRELFSRNVIAFLDKPITESSLKKVISDITEIWNHEKTFTYRKNGKMNFLKQQEILCIESEGHYINIYTKNETISYKGKIRDIWDELTAHTDFVMPNRSYILNLKYVSLASKSEFFIQILKKSISITKYNKDDTMMRFMRYLGSMNNLN